MRIPHLVEALRQDFRYGLRQLRRSPGFTALAVLSLALGIGATIAIFSVMYALALSPLPVRQPDRLVALEQAGQLGGSLYTYPQWELFRDSQDIFSNAFAVNYVDRDFSIRSDNQRQQVPGLYVSGGYFQTLGVGAYIGRALEPSDDNINAPPVCVVGYGLWREMSGQSKSIVGRTILVNGNEFQIVGVAPQSFFGLVVGSRPEIFMTLGAERRYKDYQLTYGHQTPSLDSRYGLLGVFARLKPTESVGQANAGLRILSPQINRALPPSPNAKAGPLALDRPLSAHPIPNGITEKWQEDMGVVLLMMIMAAVALIIVCANLGNLLLARASKRQGEIATRLALGASRGRLVRQLLTESAVLSAAGAAAGLVIAHWGEQLFSWALSYPSEPLHLDMQWDARLAIFSVTITLACTLLFGLAPAIRATDVSLYSAMKRSFAAGKRRNRISNSSLVVVQVALSMAVLVSAGLLARTVHSLLTANMGYDPKGVWAAQANWPVHGESLRREAFVGQELLTGFRSVPGVTSASWARDNSLPTLPQLTVAGPKGSERRMGAYPQYISSDYFKTRRAPLLAGRDFNVDDTRTSPAVAILSEALATALFGKVNPVGLSFRENDEAAGGQNYLVTVVGVAGNINYRSAEYGPLPEVYRPVSQCGGSCSEAMGDFEIRVTGSPPAMVKLLKNAAAQVDPEVGLNWFPLTDEISSGVHRNRAMAVVAATFGLFIGLLAMIGVYGVTSYSTAERTSEIGIRMALGARPSNVFQMILGETMVPVCIGVGLGVGAGFAAAQMIRGLIWGISPNDPLSFITAAGLMLLVAGAAAFVPARRAAKVDPMVALRYE